MEILLFQATVGHKFAQCFVDCIAAWQLATRIDKHHDISIRAQLLQNSEQSVVDGDDTF